MATYQYVKAVNPGQLTLELNLGGVGDDLSLIGIVTTGGITTLEYKNALQTIEEAAVTAIVNSHDINDNDVVIQRDDVLLDNVMSERGIFDLTGFNNSISGNSQIIRPPNAQIFSGYSTTGQTLTTTYFSVPINVELEKDSIFTHTANSPNVTVTKTTRIFMLGNYNADTTSARTATEGSFFINGTIVNPALCYGYHRNTAQGENTGTSFTTLYLTAGDVVSFRVREISGTAILKTPTTMRMYLEEKLNE